MASILCIVSSEELKSTFLDTCGEHRRYYRDILGIEDYPNVELLVELNGQELDIRPYNPDIIIARGITAIQIKKQNRDTPVVEIPITAADIVQAAERFDGSSLNAKGIALIGFRNVNKLAGVATRLLGVPVVPFEHYRNDLDAEHLSALMDRVAAEGFRHVLGGVRTVEIAKTKNLSAEFLLSGQESMWLALTEAQHISVIHRTERERAARFETILDHSREGIITTDDSGRVIQMNAAARNTLKIDAEEPIGQLLSRVVADEKFNELIRGGDDLSDELIKIGRKKIIVSKTAARLGGKTVGSVITFQDITNVRDTEIKIRNKLHERGLVARYTFRDIAGTSGAVRKAVETAKTFAGTQSSILITGETGTGKELFAQSIHNGSDRSGGPFVAVNCAAIPENLMESEFFGYAGGAFTDAMKEGKIGYFELAHGGTLFLDEVSEIPHRLQGKLLRVIQEGEVMPIGHDKIIPVDVRIVCASNKDLRVLTRQGAFREDLYYRLAVLQLRLPPLRDREEDILRFAEQFLNSAPRKGKGSPIGLAPELAELFLRLPWEGNIRELRNVCEQLSVLNGSGLITAEEARGILPDAGGCVPHSESATIAAAEAKTLADDLASAERERIRAALRECADNKTRAARRLGIDRSTLWRKMREHGMDTEPLRLPHP